MQVITDYLGYFLKINVLRTIIFDSKSIIVKFRYKISSEFDDCSFTPGPVHGPVNSEAMYAEDMGLETFCTVTSTWSRFLSLSSFSRNPQTADCRVTKLDQRGNGIAKKK
jgi:hypothetical protein